MATKRKTKTSRTKTATIPTTTATTSDIAREFLAETADYAVSIQRVKSTLTLSGKDTMYCVINKNTWCVECRCYSMVDVLTMLDQLQATLNAIVGRRSTLQ